MKFPAVYIMTNRPNGTLYIGVTSNLIQRVFQHKNSEVEGFTKKYNLHSLVWYQMCETMESAILREKQLKAGSRKKKVMLIEDGNSEWRDLYDDILG